MNLFSNPCLLLFCKVKALVFNVCSCGAQLFQYSSYMMQDELHLWFMKRVWNKPSSQSSNNFQFSLKNINMNWEHNEIDLLGLNSAGYDNNLYVNLPIHSSFMSSHYLTSSLIQHILFLWMCCRCLCCSGFLKTT